MFQSEFELFVTILVSHKRQLVDNFSAILTTGMLGGVLELTNPENKGAIVKTIIEGKYIKEVMFLLSSTKKIHELEILQALATAFYELDCAREGREARLLEGIVSLVNVPLCDGTVAQVAPQLLWQQISEAIFAKAPIDQLFKVIPANAFDDKLKTTDLRNFLHHYFFTKPAVIEDSDFNFFEEPKSTPNDIWQYPDFDLYFPFYNSLPLEGQQLEQEVGGSLEFILFNPLVAALALPENHFSLVFEFFCLAFQQGLMPHNSWLLFTVSQGADISDNLGLASHTNFCTALLLLIDGFKVFLDNMQRSLAEKRRNADSGVKDLIYSIEDHLSKSMDSLTCKKKIIEDYASQVNTDNACLSL